MAKKRRTSFGQLTHRDLKGFDQRAARLVLEAIDAGCTGRISSKGHAILRNSAGQTASVPPTSIAPNRSAQNAAAGIKRLLEGHTARSEASSPHAIFASPISVAEALELYGMTFSNWMDTYGGLSPDDEIEVVPAPDGSPLFSLPPVPDPTPVETPAIGLNGTAQERSEAPVTAEAFGEVEEVVYSVADIAETNSVTGKTVRNRLRAIGGRDNDGRYRPTPSMLRRAGLKVPSVKVPSDQFALPTDATEILSRIRSLLGEDPRVQVLEAEKKTLSGEVTEQERRAVAAEERCAELEQELSEIRARLALVKEAFEA